MNALKKLNKKGTKKSTRTRPSLQPSVPSLQPSVPVQRIQEKPSGIKLLDNNGKVIEPPQVNKRRYVFKPSSNETRFYMSVIPWMSARNDGIFILSIGDTDISPYLVKEVPSVRYTVEHNGQIFKRTNNKFRQLMVDYRFNRTQIDEVLYVNTSKGVLKFKVGYLIKNKLLIQNEDIFSNEMKFFNDGLETQYTRIMKIKDEQPIEEDVKRLGVSVLSKVLHDVAPNVLSYGLYDGVIKRDTSYNIKVIDTLVSKSLTVNDFFEHLGNIVIFITTINFSNVFKERLREEYYLPEILANLPLSEKLPEIYDRNISSREKEKDRMNELIEQTLRIFVYRLLVLTYVRRNPTERIESGTVNYSITPSISNLFNIMSDWKSECVNDNNIPDNEIVLYKDEHENVYCLSIPDVVSSIKSGTNINSYTGKKYSDEFIQYINTYYTIVEKEETPEEDVNDIVENIENLNINNELDIEDLFSDLMMDEQEQETTREVQEEEYPDSDEEMVDVPNNSNKTKCPVCEKMFTATGGYKTLDVNDNSKSIEYCSMECFDK